MKEKIPQWWNQACLELKKNDPFLRKIINKNQNNTLITREKPFLSLVKSIVGQQISVKAADSIWKKIELELVNVNIEVMQNTNIEQLRKLGLSYRKAEYILELSFKLKDKNNIMFWNKYSDAEAIKELTLLRGVGDWTAKMFLMFCLNRPDIFSGDDIGLLKAISIHYKNNEKITKKDAEEFAKRWIPWRTAASWFLWKTLDPVPVEY